jgi:hypothetical protein
VVEVEVIRDQPHRRGAHRRSFFARVACDRGSPR